MGGTDYGERDDRKHKNKECISGSHGLEFGDMARMLEGKWC